MKNNTGAKQNAQRKIQCPASRKQMQNTEKHEAEHGFRKSPSMYKQTQKTSFEKPGKQQQAQGNSKPNKRRQGQAEHVSIEFECAPACRFRIKTNAKQTSMQQKMKKYMQTEQNESTENKQQMKC